jgi:hypothetical protein
MNLSFWNTTLLKQDVQTLFGISFWSSVNVIQCLFSQNVLFLTNTKPGEAFSIIMYTVYMDL